MKICDGRKHNWVSTASPGLDVFRTTKLVADSNMKDGYKFPCCQLTVPTVCCKVLFNNEIMPSLRVTCTRKKWVLTSTTRPDVDS